MRIIIYSINYSPELIGIGKYNGEMAEWLVENGHEVKVITAPPYYPEWKICEGYLRHWYQTELLNAVQVTRCPIWVPDKPTGLKRVLHLLSFALTSSPVILWQAIMWKPDKIFVVEPPFFCTPATIIASRLSGAKSHLHIQDYEIDAAFDLGLLKSARLRKLIHSFESWIMKRFDKVTTISVQMLEKALTKGVAPGKLELFENWVLTNHIYPLDSTPAIYHELGLPDNRIIILYSGNMGEKQGLELILEAAEKMCDREDVLYVLCGTGSARDRLISLSAHLRNVRFFPLQPFDKLNELLNLAHIHLLPQKPGAEDLVMPSKLTNMMASGRPIVATAMPHTQIAYVLKNCGIVVAPGDSDAFTEAINRLIDDTAECARLGGNGRKYAVNNWSQDSLISSAFSDM